MSMSAASIDRHLRFGPSRAGPPGAGPTPSRARCSSPRSRSAPGPSGTRTGPDSSRSTWSATRAATPRGVLLHPDRDRHRHGLDRQPLGQEQGGHLGLRGHRPTPQPGSPSRSSASTRTTARSSSTPTSSSTAPNTRSPSPGPGRATRTTGATSSRRTGPTSASSSATCALTPRPSSSCSTRSGSSDTDYTNYLLTQQKLVSKERHGAKVTKRHDRAATPYDRAVAHPQTSSDARSAMAAALERHLPR